MTKTSLSRGTKVADQDDQISHPRDGVEPAIAARWKAAEAHLYPLIMVDPDIYETAVTLVGEVTEVLRKECGTLSELVNVEPTGALAQCPSAAALSALGFDPNTAFGAACACRWRELIGSQPGADTDSSSDGE